MGRKKMPSVKLEMLTPKMAKKMLTLDKRNRKRDMVKVRKYAKDMERGTFLLTSIGIGVDINNEITNGGHRLDACVLANVPVSIIVARNLPPEARNHVDTGKNRSFANSLEMSNLCCTRSNDTNKVIGKGNYTKMVASTVSYIILHQTGNFDRLGSVSGLISNQEVVDFVSNNEEELTNSAQFISKHMKGIKYAQKPLMMFIYQMHKLYGGDERIKEFIKIVCGHAVSKEPLTCPAHHLKTRLISNHAKATGKLRTQHLVGLYVDASNKFMKNLSVKSIRTKSSKTQVNTVQPVGEITSDVKEFFNAVNQSLHTA